MRFLLRSCLLLLATGLCTGAMASNVYQWKDSKGVTHSSDKPPAGQKYDTRRIDGRVETVEAAQPDTAAESPQCASARHNLQLLGSGGPLQLDTDGDGKPDQTMTDEERASHTSLAEAAVKAYCPPAG